MSLAPSYAAGTPMLPPGIFAGQIAFVTEPDAIGQAVAVELAR